MLVLKLMRQMNVEDLKKMTITFILLIAANAMMRQMALQANPSDKLEGFKKVTSYLELGQFMQNSKLLDVGLKALEHQIDMPSKGIPIKSLTSNTK